MSGSEGKRRGFKVRAMNPLQDNRCTLISVPLQNNPKTSRSQQLNIGQHIRAIRRAMCDAYVMLSSWPACIRYSYMVGSDGRLMTRAERRGGK
jgi:hypothetical protein